MQSARVPALGTEWASIHNVNDLMEWVDLADPYRGKFMHALDINGDVTVGKAVSGVLSSEVAEPSESITPVPLQGAGEWHQPMVARIGLATKRKVAHGCVHASLLRCD